MQTLLLNLLLINVIAVLIIDMTDAPDTLKKGLSWLLTLGKMRRSDYRFHLFDCSLCITFWSSIIYILLSGQFCLYAVALCIASAVLTQTVKSIILLCIDIINAVIILFNKLLKLISRI